MSKNIKSAAAKTAVPALNLNLSTGNTSAPHPVPELVAPVPAKNFADLPEDTAKWPKDALKAARLIAVPAREVVEGTVSLSLSYLKLCLAIRKSPLSPKNVTQVLKQQGFKDSRISELKRVSYLPDKAFSEYESGSLGFKATLELARLDKKTQALLPAPPTPPPAAPAKEPATPAPAPAAPSPGAVSPVKGPEGHKVNPVEAADAAIHELLALCEAFPFLAENFPLNGYGKLKDGREIVVSVGFAK